MTKKTNLAKKAAVTKKMKTALADALTDEETIVGRVVGALGNGGFRVSLKDKEVQGLIRGVFKGGKNSESFVCAGMYVILAPNSSRSDMKVHEIIGVINNKKDMKALKEAGLITEDAKDDLFDYSDDESEKPDLTAKDIDVDAL